MKDSKREAYSSKSHFREKISQKVSFVDPIVPSYTLETSFPSPSLISSLPNKDILPISPQPLDFYDHSQEQQFFESSSTDKVCSTHHDDNNSINIGLSFHEIEIFETPVLESKNETGLKENSLSKVEPNIKHFFSLDQSCAKLLDANLLDPLPIRKAKWKNQAR